MCTNSIDNIIKELQALSIRQEELLAELAQLTLTSASTSQEQRVSPIRTNTTVFQVGDRVRVLTKGPNTPKHSAGTINRVHQDWVYIQIDIGDHEVKRLAKNVRFHSQEP